MSVVINDSDGKIRIIVFPRTPNFFSFFILEKSYDKLDDFDHNQASSEQEKEIKKLIQG